MTVQPYSSKRVPAINENAEGLLFSALLYVCVQAIGPTVFPPPYVISAPSGRAPPHQTPSSKRRSKSSTRASASGGANLSRTSAAKEAVASATPRRAFRPSGIAKPVPLSPRPSSPSPPRTRKQSLERRESSQSPLPLPPSFSTRYSSPSPQGKPHHQKQSALRHGRGIHFSLPQREDEGDFRSKPLASHRVPTHQYRSLSSRWQTAKTRPSATP